MSKPDDSPNIPSPLKCFQSLFLNFGPSLVEVNSIMTSVSFSKAAILYLRKLDNIIYM